MPNPVFKVLQADTELSFDLDRNYGVVEVAIVANGANTWFNTSNTPIGAVAGNMDGNHILTTTLPAKTVLDLTEGANSKIRLRSSGTPTVQVTGL